MTKKMFLVFLCLSIFPVFAQEDNDKRLTGEPTNVSFEEKDEINSYKQLITELELQKESLEKENEQIQKALTISNQAFDRVTNAYWALFGIIITIIIFVFTGNFILQHFDKKKISKDLFEEILSKCMNEINKTNSENQKKIQYISEETERKVKYTTQEAIEGIKELQLELLKQELEKDKEEGIIPSTMNTTLGIISLYFDLYGEDRPYNQYDGYIIENFNYLKKCLKDGNKFWNWNIEIVNKLKKSCPERLSSEFDKVLKLVEFES